MIPEIFAPLETDLRFAVTSRNWEDIASPEYKSAGLFPFSPTRDSSAYFIT